MLAMKLDFEEYTPLELEVRADPRIYDFHPDWPLRRLAKIYGISYPKFLALVLHWRGYL